VFGWFGGTKRKLEEARALESRGELDAAALAFLESEAPEEAARVWLAAADAETRPERRLARYGHVATLAGPAAVEAGRRRARLAFDLARGGTMTHDLLRAAEALAAVELHREAAEAFRLAGDTEAELRQLALAGALVELETRHADEEARARASRARRALLAEVGDLDAIGERTLALDKLGTWLAAQDDEEVRDVARALDGRLTRGPVVALEVDGERRLLVLGDEVILGRSDADLVVAAPALSRRHARFFQIDGTPYVEDLGTRNGTFLAGQRLAGPIALTRAQELMLAGDVPCHVAPHPQGGLEITVAGRHHHLPLGPARVLGWQLERDSHRAREVVLLTSTGDAPPYRGKLACSTRLVLSRGDALATERGGPVRLEVHEDERT